MRSWPMSWGALGMGLLAAVVFTGCPDQGVVCGPGLERCGKGCADFRSDERNCGACGAACGVGQLCSEGQCLCRSGTQPCQGSCVVVASDPLHCGGCGQACATGEVCEQGQCKRSCALGASTQCGGGCVDLSSDPLHCGGCDQVCENAQSCHGGSCSYDLVAACFSSGQVTGLQANAEFKGPLEPLGSGPQALAVSGRTLLSVDGIDQRLYEARLASVGGRAFAMYPEAPATGAVPNQVKVSGDRVYVVNAGSGTLQVLRAGVADGGAFDADAGLGLATVGEVSFGANSFPEAAAELGGSLYVTLYGGYGAAAAAEGQKVVRVDVSTPALPVVVDTFDLTSLDLRPFDGGAPVPRPFAIVTHQGKLFAALNNLNADTYAPEGPGLLARVDPVARQLSTVDLGAVGCLNPIWLVSDGAYLYVSCQGAAVYGGPPSYELLSTEGAGLVVVGGAAGAEQPLAFWKAECPSGAAPLDVDAGTGCAPVLPSRFAVKDRRVFLGDQNGGRVFVLDWNGTSLSERRGYAADAGAPVQACALDPVTGISNVSDVLAVE